MLANRVIIAITLLVGLAGGWTLWDATEQYVGVARAFARVTVTYQPGSFRWTDAEYVSATATFAVTNDAAQDATLESIDLHLRYNGKFAGSNYARFEPLPIPAGETRLVEIPLTVTSGGKGDGREAELSIRGTAVFRFSNISRSRGVDVSAEIGRVPQVGP